jgi:uncharacterized protein (TIGR02001 family)
VRTGAGPAACAATAFLLALSSPAHAQLAGGLTLQSDYRQRGVSLSDLRPALSLTLGDDFANGVYVGASTVAQDAAQEGPRLLGHMEYLGYAARRSGGLGWDVGVDNQDFSVHGQGRIRSRYTEAYFGLSDGDLGARLYLSPNYLRSGLSVAYLDLNGAYRPSTDWRLAAHLGVFQPLAGTAGTTVRETRYDLRFDAVRRLGPVELDLGWTTAFPAALPETRRSRPAMVIGATAFF